MDLATVSVLILRLKLLCLTKKN